MANILELIENVQKLDLDKISEESVSETKEIIVSINNKQLLAGKDNRGEDLTPSYLNDPYFKSKKSAEKYSKWKDEITPHPTRKSGVPNLYINGAYHNSRSMEVRGKDIDYKSSYKDAYSIENKFPETYGLSPDNKQDYTDEHLRPIFLNNVKKELGFGL
jgi:hypothetical protein